MNKRMWLVVGLTAIITAAMVLPAYGAITRFTDVPDSNIFAEDINWMDENGITSGCGADTYCPTANVTRQQMSAFMHRLATYQVVDAAELEGLKAADFATAGHNHDAAYLAKTGTAADSELLDGRNANDLIRVASLSFTGPLETNDYASLKSFDIEAPTAGFLMLSSNLEFWTTATSETVWCGWGLNGSQVLAGGASRVDLYNPAGNIEASCAAETVVAVAAGTHTLTIMGRYDNYPASHFAWGSGSALFIPFDGTGTPPMIFVPPAAPANQLP
jgi:hypothetical protein